MSKKKETVGAYIEWELLDPKGRVVKRGRQPVKSWVKQWMIALYSNFLYSSQTATDITGASRTGNIFFVAVNAPAGNASYGIVVGTSDTPVTRDDYKLGSQIAHGNATGQLTYGAVSVDAPVTYSTGYLIRVVRVFTNNGSGDVTVKEIGVYFYNQAYYFCMIRDVLSTPVTIPAGYSWTVRYNFYFVV
jgi:hypothetical protein